MRLYSRKIVKTKVPFSDSTLWRLERSGGFPKSFRISANRVAYNADEIDQWIEERMRHKTTD